MKNYKEVANNVFERRNKYIKQRKEKIKIAIAACSTLLCSFILLTSFGLWKGGFFDNYIGVTRNPQKENSSKVSGSAEKYPYFENNSSNNSSYDKYSSSSPSYVNPDNPSYQENSFIDSIDKVNFYSAKKIISENSLLPIGMGANGLTMTNITKLVNTYAEYPIDKNKVFTITMVTYFKIELNNEKGFLAQKLGGTGLVEVVVTENNLEQLGQMITFKRNDEYYTCLMNNGEYNDGGKKSYGFSSHKYIKGFNLVKNEEQENYRFTVHYDGTKVVGFDCEPYHSEPKKYVVDDVTLVEDYCIVFYTKQNFTIGQLEYYYKNEEKDETL
ncbi:MAG: hypothetical protein E7568_01445 [Ruminococcaceae bacterium]|nr:hypothetical protein [Oscillospiraceae bacterium]